MLGVMFCMDYFIICIANICSTGIVWNGFRPPICTAPAALSPNPSSFYFLHLRRAIPMASGAGSVGSHGGNGACRGGRRDAGVGSSTRSLFVPIGGGDDDGGDRAWLVFLQLSKHLAPATSNLCAAERALRAANAAVLANEEGGRFCYTEAMAAYDLSYEEYKAASE